MLKSPTLMVAYQRVMLHCFHPKSISNRLENTDNNPSLHHSSLFTYLHSYLFSNRMYVSKNLFKPFRWGKVIVGLKGVISLETCLEYLDL